jgi:pyruvate/2-oxoglutarate dehydrogenase complex dihydrolipoamide acyltransferase (E2) component
MAQEFRLPDIGEGLAEGEIVRWHVPVGGEVQLDETVVEVETDKAVIEVPSPYSGVVLHHGAAEGEVLAVGEILMVVGQPGETWAAPAPSPSPSRAGAEPSAGDAAPIVGTLSEEAVDLTPAAARAHPSGRRPKALPKVRRLAHQLGVDLAAVAATGPDGLVTGEDVAARAPDAAVRGNGERPRSWSPLVRKLAENLGVDLGTVAGSGPGGRVTRDDVLSAAASGPGGVDAAMASPGPPRVVAAPPADGPERRRLSPVRRAIAARMSRSWAEIPQVTAFDQVDATRLLAARAALQARHGVTVPVDALVVAAVVPVLRAFPEVNASLEGDELILHHRQDVGLAVDTPDGLLVAVVRDAGSLDLIDLSAEVRRLGERARARALGPADLSGQTFTVSNIGGVGGGHGTPLVPPGTVGILSVGRAVDAPVVRDGAVAIAPMMPLSLSYDHRVVDGAAGRRFLAMLTENLAEPTLFLA